MKFAVMLKYDFKKTDLRELVVSGVGGNLAAKDNGD